MDKQTDEAECPTHTGDYVGVGYESKKAKIYNEGKQSGKVISYLKQVDVNINCRFTEMRLYVSHCLITNLMTIPHPHTSQDFIVAHLYATTTIITLVIIQLSK